MRFDPIGLLSKLLEKIGLKTWKEKSEFSGHIAWGLTFGLAGLYWHWGLWIAWTVFVLYDEFYCDKHWKVFIGQDEDWKDLWYDLFSKLIGIVIFSIIYVIS